MEMKKLFVAMTAVSAMALTACGSDDDNDSDGGNKVSANTFRATTSDIVAGDACATVGSFSGLDIKNADGSYTPLCDLSGTISQDATLTTEFAYRMTGYTYVGTGNAELDAYADASEVTLTVNAGVQFRSSSSGTLIVTRGSNINMNGTAAAPIVMSSTDVDFDGQGQWGGLVVQGFAKNNQCANEYAANEVCNTADEANSGFHGGENDADNSGSITYVIVAEGGYETAPDSEINGITLHSVGYGTTIENVMVYNNADDGIEFFGGAANVKNLILVDNGDESLDWDDGWRGNVQFSLIRQGLVNGGDNGIEADNKGLSNTAQPVSNPTIANVTFQTGAEGSSYLMRAKLGTAGTLVNVAADNYAKAFRVADSETDVTLTNVLVEFSGTEASDILRLENGATAANIDGWESTSTTATVELGNAFEVMGSQSTLTTPATLNSANGSTGFFDQAGAGYIGAVAPTVTDKANAWWSWADAVVPAAFK